MRGTVEQAKERMQEEILHWAAKLRVSPRRVQIQRMTTKWASCSTNGRVCFSLGLLDEPASFREVVIVHELLHLLVPNHGKLFESLMNVYLPGWEARVAGRVSLCGTSGVHCGAKEARSHAQPYGSQSGLVRFQLARKILIPAELWGRQMRSGCSRNQLLVT